MLVLTIDDVLIHVSCAHFYSQGNLTKYTVYTIHTHTHARIHASNENGSKVTARYRGHAHTRARI